MAALVAFGGAAFVAATGIALWRRPVPAPAVVVVATLFILAFWSSGVGFRRSLVLAVPAFPALAALLGRRNTYGLSLAFAVITPLLVIAYLKPPYFLTP